MDLSHCSLPPPEGFNFQVTEFFNENRDVTVYLPDQIRHYEIFAAYTYDSRHILQTYDFTDEKIYEYYLRKIFSMRDMSSFVDTSYELDKNPCLYWILAILYKASESLGLNFVIFSNDFRASSFLFTDIKI